MCRRLSPKIIDKLGLGWLALPGDQAYFQNENSSGEGFVVIQYLLQRSQSDLGTMNNYFYWKSEGPPEIDYKQLDRKT